MDYNKAVDEAKALAEGVRQHNNKYNHGHPLEDFFLHGPQDIVYELYKKVLRMDSLLTAGKSLQCLDSGIDIINFAAYLVGLLRIGHSEEAFNAELERIGLSWFKTVTLPPRECPGHDEAFYAGGLLPPIPQACYPSESEPLDAVVDYDAIEAERAKAMQRIAEMTKPPFQHLPSTGRQEARAAADSEGGCERCG